jgi:NADH-quinone oxidoreductase subunit H
MSSISGNFAFLGLSLIFLLLFVLILFYSERKLAAFMQDRTGPLHNGIFGSLQPFADLLKLVRKETIVPEGANRFFFMFAPFLVFAPVLAGFSLLPLWPQYFAPAGTEAGLFILPAVISLEAVGILMAAWASQSRFPRIAAARAIAQLLAYEVPLGLVILSVIWLNGSADFSELELQQISSGFFSWNIVRQPVNILLVPIFFLCILAESNRAPFDIPEGESEIIGGFHTEYSGFLWAVFFLAEYAMMLLLSLVFCYLFLGGSGSPFPKILPVLSEPSFFWLAFKAIFLGILMIWIRWTLPRLRADQLGRLAWHWLSPFAFLLLLGIVLLG